MGSGNMMGWGGGLGGGWGGGHMLGFGLIGLVLVVAVVLVFLLAARSRSSRADPVGHRGEDRALAILKERYARGELDKTEFDARKRDLS